MVGPRKGAAVVGGRSEHGEGSIGRSMIAARMANMDVGRPENNSPNSDDFSLQGAAGLLNVGRCLQYAGRVTATRIATALALAALLGVVLAGCEILSPQPKAEFTIEGWEQFHYTLAARFEIIDWEQSYYSSLGEHGLVQINYRITNIGTLDIRYYKVWFEVRCDDGTKFKEWTNGVDVWDYETSSTYVDTSGRRAVSVSVSDYELKPPVSQEPKTLVRIDYRITNTGPVSIDYYKVWFEARCADGETFSDWTNGALISNGQSYTGLTFITAGPNSNVVSVSVLKYELTHHSIWH